MNILKDNLIEKEIELIKNKISHNEISLAFGKMIRSQIGLLLLKSLDIEITEPYLNFLSAVELVHNASLLHDDVMDNEDERRGQPTVNRQFDNKSAILFGNLLISKAFKLILETKSLELVGIINKTIRDMCKGELLQKSLEYKIPTMDEYIEKTKLKTGALFMAVTRGIIELSGKDISQLNQFTENFGIAFQIQNDLKNSSNSDIDNGIYTAPIIYSNSLTISKSAIEKTIDLIDNYTEKAEAALDCLEDSDYKNKLIGVIKCLKK